MYNKYKNNLNMHVFKAFSSTKKVTNVMLLYLRMTAFDF